MMSEVETMETRSSGGVVGGLLDDQVNLSNLNEGVVGRIDYLTVSTSIGGDDGGGTSFQPLETICELNSSSMPYLYSTDLSLDSVNVGDGRNLEATIGENDGGEQGSSQNFEASLITLNDISNSYHGNPLASLGGLEGWKNGGIEDYNWINNDENLSIPVNTPSLSTCSTSLYNFFEEDEKECQKDLDELLRTAFGTTDGLGENGLSGVGPMLYTPTPTGATSLEYAVKSVPVQSQYSDEEKDDDEDDPEGNSEEEDDNEEITEEKGKKERHIRQERCSECNIDFPLPSRYERHMEEVHSEKFPYPCAHPGCSKKFAKHHQLQQHTYIHDPKRFEGKGKWECGLCDKTYHVRCSLYQHWKSNHPGIGPEERKELIKKAKEENNLKNGRDIGRIRNKTETVPVVGPGVTQIFRKMKKRQILEEKKKRREEAKMAKNEEAEVELPPPATPTPPVVVVGECRPGYYPCHFCGKVFDASWNLKMHVMLHTGEKPLKCPKCPERFRLKQTLTNHMRRKHRSAKERRNILKMYKCRVCGKDDFEMWQNLYSHRLKHKEVEYDREKEKPFGCGICLKPHFLREDAIICAVLGHLPEEKGGKGGKRWKERAEEVRRKGLMIEGLGFENALYFDLTEWGPSEEEQHWMARQMLEVMCKGGKDGTQMCTLCGEEMSNKGNFKRHLNLVHVSEELSKRDKELEGDGEEEKDEEEEIEEEEPPKKKIKQEIVEEEKEVISSFKCRFCNKKFAKKRALHFHEVRGHINPKPRNEEKSSRKGKKEIPKEEVVVKEEDDSSNGSDLFIKVVGRRNRGSARKNGQEKKKEEDKLKVKTKTVNLNDPIAIANALNFKSLTVVVRDLSREEILRMNEGKIGNLSALDGRKQRRVVDEEDAGSSQRRRGRPSKNTRKEEQIKMSRRGSVGRGRGRHQRENKTEQMKKDTGKGTGRRGRPPKRGRGRWGKIGNKVVMEQKDDEEESSEDKKEEEDAVVEMTKKLKGIAKVVVEDIGKVLAVEKKTDNETIDKVAEEVVDSNKRVSQNLDNKEDDGSGALITAAERLVDASNDSDDCDDDDLEDEADEDLEDMIQEELEEMMEEAQLDEWLAQEVLPIAEDEDSVQFLGEFSGSEEEDGSVEEEQEGIQRVQVIGSGNSTNESSTEEEEEVGEEEYDDDDEDVEEEEMIVEEENANLEAIVPMHQDEVSDDEEDFEEDPLLLDNFSLPPTPRSPPPREPAPQRIQLEVEDEELDVDEEDDDEDVEEEEEEEEGMVSSTTQGYQIGGHTYNLDVEDTNSSVIFEGVHEDKKMEGEEETSASAESEEILPLRNIPGINPNLINGLPKVVLRRIEQDHTLNLNLSLVRNQNEDSV